MTKKKEKPFKWKVIRPARPDRPLDRLEPEPDKEVLTGLVRGEPASDLEERLYGALVAKFGANNVEFQPSYLGIRNLTEVRPDFAIHGGAKIIIIFADDKFTHGTAETIEHDKLSDARLMQAMAGEIEIPVHISDRELDTKDAARAAVEKRW
ncbi:MAG: hypothetical protein WC935_00215 [Thermoleophilia bacterium]